MANKVSKTIKDVEVIEDTKVATTVEEQTDDTSVEQEYKTTEEPTKCEKKGLLPGFINEESVAKARPIIGKVVKGLGYVAAFYVGWKIKDFLLGGNEEDHDYHESFDDTPELIDAEFTVVDSEE